MGLFQRAGAARVTNLSDGWRLALTPAGACASPAEASRLTDWIPAPVPGTVAQALQDAGRWRREQPEPLHDKDAWYRLALTETGRRRLSFEGLATLAEVWLGERPILASASMFQPADVEIEVAAGETLWLCFRALGPGLASAKGPRARWRPFMIENQALRFLRTTLLGHMGGWCPPVHAVGPWRPIRLIEDGPIAFGDIKVRPHWGDRGARLEIELSIDAPNSGLRVECAGASAPFEPAPGGGLRAELGCPQARTWWPHTHGDQPLYPITVHGAGEAIDLGRTGFRSLEAERGPDGRGFGLRVNGEPVFCRGACWTPADLVSLGGGRNAYEPTLRLAREAGMNMIRIPGVALYESPEFFELCDELGLMVWQDFMFANFDYPAADPAFAQAVRGEAEALLSELQANPSLAVLCGGSEVMQQAAMMGLPAHELTWPVFDEVLPEVCARFAPGVPYAPNSPSGGALPFVANEGVTHYYGVGAYERPLEDARRAGVRFASECLAFANVPQPEVLRGEFAVPAVHDPRWKARVPRDRGASWDFEDVRDHYLGRLFEQDPARLRREDPELYLDLSRAVSGEAMAAVFSEWRRRDSGCEGGLVWLLRDFALGAGWGVIDATGEPKPAWYALRRVLQPVQVLITDEGLNGLAIQLINETAEPVSGELRLAVFGDEPGPLIDVARAVDLAPRSKLQVSDFELIGRFFDSAYAYRFGPRAQEAVFAELRVDGALISYAVHRLAPPLPRPGGVQAEVVGEKGNWRLRLEAERFQPLIHISDPHFRPDDDWFALAPGERRTVRLLGRKQAALDARPQGEVFAPGGRLLGSYRLD